jgi:uncharacterized integral membrane protein (TIGR00698 family)
MTTAPAATKPANPPAPPRPHAAGLSALAPVALLAGGAFSLSPWATPQTSLGAGIVLALLALVPRDVPAQALAKFLIQVSVVLLGFTMDLHEVLRAGAAGVLFAAVTIVATFALGELIRRLLAIDRTVSTLISSGTAICGGSAIAAVGATIGAPAPAMAVSMATIFLLNGIALFVFPALGHAMHLTPEQFGAWAGVAIHDISSVVGAAAQYDPPQAGAESIALHTATAVKLSRVLWLIPVCVLAARLMRPGHAERAAPGGPPVAPRPRAPIPWFVLLFLIAALLHTFVPQIRGAAAAAVATSRTQMQLALFLIGTGLSVPALRAVGPRPLVQAAALWVFISVAALGAIRLAL